MFNEVVAASLPTAALGMRLFVAAIFLLGGIQKLQSRLEFEGILHQYKIAFAAASPALSWIVPCLELACAGLLLFMPTTGSALAATILCAYAAAMSINLLRGRAHIDCGCGGEATPLSPGLVGRNLLMALGLLFCFVEGTLLQPVTSANYWLAPAFAAGLFALYVSFNQLQTNAGIYRRLWLGERVG